MLAPESKPTQAAVAAKRPTMRSDMPAGKRDWRDLAIFGGEPSFREPLHVGRPNIGNRGRLFERINDLLTRAWLTNNGPYAQELEQRISKLLAVKHCIATCNGTVALEIAIRALGLSGEVIVPSFTFIATAHALRWLSLTPVFCDIDPHTHNLDPRQLERVITPRTSGIIGVHLWGRPCEAQALADIAERRGLALLFDAAHAFACSHQGRMVGNFGSVEVFSFHATKFFNTFEGGAITTNDDTLAARARLMVDFGFAGPDNAVAVGTNGKMSEVSAAMGLTGLESLEEFIAANQRNYEHYESELAGVPGIHLVRFDETEKCNYQYVVVEVDETAAQIGRDRLLQILHAENVLARRYFYPGCHRMEPYRSENARAGILPATELLAGRVLVLPTGTAAGADTVRGICAIIRLAITHGREIQSRLAESP